MLKITPENVKELSPIVFAQPKPPALISRIINRSKVYVYATSPASEQFQFLIVPAASFKWRLPLFCLTFFTPKSFLYKTWRNISLPLSHCITGTFYANQRFASQRSNKHYHDSSCRLQRPELSGGDYRAAGSSSVDNNWTCDFRRGPEQSKHPMIRAPGGACRCSKTSVRLRDRLGNGNERYRKWIICKLAQWLAVNGSST